MQQLPYYKRSCIPELLARKGKLQVDLAVHLDKTEAYISQVIACKANLSVPLMRKTALYFNCLMEELYEWNEF